MAALENTRFTLMAFPQKVDKNGYLHLNLLFVPRNFNPLKSLFEIFGTHNGAPAFVDYKPIFNAMVVNNPNDFPGKLGNEGDAISLDIIDPKDFPKRIYQALKETRDEEGNLKYFDIEDSHSHAPEHQAPKAVEFSKSIKKYLPISYQKAFNFTGPRTENAVTDDSYLCAMRNRKEPKDVPRYTKVSWGKVYAHLLRQPQLAEKAGLLYRNIKFKLKENDYEKGGWLYINIANNDQNDAYYQLQQDTLNSNQDIFIKRYAARIPPLKRKNNQFIERRLFAALLFPVMKPGEDPEGIYDELYIESSAYNDGFAKIVHANQPVSSNLLAEEQDGMPPQQEMGIRLGWDDEQILIWYIRQLAKDPNVNGGNDRLDAPLGVMGYQIDVKEKKESTDQNLSWESLTAVKSHGDLFLEDPNKKPINLGSFNGELPFQVYPIKTYGEEENYWLPMYFANWNDHSMALPDKTASDLYRNQDAIKKTLIKDPEKIPDPDLNPEEKEDLNVSISDTYQPLSQNNKLRYGKSYNFRVRLSDITGGGPDVEQTNDKNSGSKPAEIHFKRYVAPYAIRIINDEEIKPNSDDLSFEGDILQIKRPLIGYPAVVYTGKYKNPVALLQKSIQSQLKTSKVVVGLADPDVISVEIKIEVETLKMDNLASDSGRENFITLYTTTRNFKDDYDSLLDLNFVYKDYKVIDFNLPFENEENKIHEENSPIILPTCRTIRVTLRAKCEGEATYWGSISSTKEADSRYGKPTSLKMRRNSIKETQLLNGTEASRFLQGIFLKPDPILPRQGQITTNSILPADGGLPNILQRLAQQLNVDCNNDPKNLTLIAEKGERIQFWCSNLIRHTLSPDKSSITFAGKNELINKWLVATTIEINRDWTWDGFETMAFTIERKLKAENNPTDAEARKKMMKSITYRAIGDLDILRIASFQAIQAGEDDLIHRKYTRIIFIDAIDPLPGKGKSPDTICVQYKISPILKKGIKTDKKSVETESLLLPTTINPMQTPKIIGSGIALSPYMKDKKYSSTEPRKRYLWLEFEQKPDDDRDELFARQVAYSPDQLISNNHPSLFKSEEDVPLVLNPEYTRVIIPDSGHDHAGLKAMKKMHKSLDANRHFYLLPLPEGLHHQSPELFGFHTYEFRFGHSDRLWSTAQGRFSRPFRLTGLQHPAPTLLCSVARLKKGIDVSAPYAMAVSNGKNVTAIPPRTSIWCLLYAQVIQADGKEFRNILIHERKLEYVITSEERSPINPITGGFITTRDLGKPAYAKISFTNYEINDRLKRYGLPEDAPLSVLCVEVFGQIRNIVDHISGIKKSNRLANDLMQRLRMDFDSEVSSYMHMGRIGGDLAAGISPSKDDGIPMSNDLGEYRILRTSPLTEIPSTCYVEY